MTDDVLQAKFKELCTKRKIAVLKSSSTYRLRSGQNTLSPITMSTDICGDVQTWSGRCGMRQLESAVFEVAAKQFEEFAKTAGFELLGEEALTILVDDDRLVARNEEARARRAVQDPVSALEGGVPSGSCSGGGVRRG
jgi:hypothetical protein